MQKTTASHASPITPTQHQRKHRNSDLFNPAGADGAEVVWVTEGAPKPEARVTVMVRDGRGGYVVPFLCRFTDGRWRNAMTGDLLAVSVVGWYNAAAARREHRS